MIGEKKEGGGFDNTADGARGAQGKCSSTIQLSLPATKDKSVGWKVE